MLRYPWRLSQLQQRIFTKTASNFNRTVTPWVESKNQYFPTEEPIKTHKVSPAGANETMGSLWRANRRMTDPLEYSNECKRANQNCCSNTSSNARANQSTAESKELFQTPYQIARFETANQGAVFRRIKNVCLSVTVPSEL